MSCCIGYGRGWVSLNRGWVVRDYGGGAGRKFKRRGPARARLARLLCTLAARVVHQSAHWLSSQANNSPNEAQMASGTMPASRWAAEPARFIHTARRPARWAPSTSSRRPRERRADRRRARGPAGGAGLRGAVDLRMPLEGKAFHLLLAEVFFY